jgi:hypothetical protein
VPESLAKQSLFLSRVWNKSKYIFPQKQKQPYFKYQELLSIGKGDSLMSYCPICGNKIEEQMVFCPNCGTSLKGAPLPDQMPPDQPLNTEKHERNQNPSREIHEKSEFGFVGYLMGGSILITIAAFALLDLSNPKNSSQDLAAMLLVIGIIIILGAIYIAITIHKRSSELKLKQLPQEDPVKPVL